MVNDVKENDGDPEGDSVKKETCSHHSDVLGNILLVMQACFIVMCTKSCNGCHEMSKTLQSMSSHLEGWHALDVYKPYRTQRSTVKTSSNCSNRLCYQFPIWLTTAGTDLKGMLCLGKLTCEKMVVRLQLTTRKLAQWKEGCLQDLKEVVEAALVGLGDGFVRFGLWTKRKSRRVESAMGKDQVAALER